MFKFFFKKQRHIESLIFAYLNNFRITRRMFADAFNICKSDPTCGDFDFLTNQTHKFESKADDIREEINELMYGKALLPESRGDIMGLLESMDEILRYFETILHRIKDQKLAIPKFIMPDIEELLTCSLESCDLMLEQVDALFRKGEGIRKLVYEIDLKESQCDHIERRLFKAIFDSDLDNYQKIQAKEIVLLMGEIPDQVDRVSKRVNIIRMKRVV